MGAFGDDALVRPVGNALQPLGLVEQVGELGAGPLEACRIDVGDVVGDDFQVQLLGVHAGRGDGESSHRLLPQIAIRLTSR